MSKLITIILELLAEAYSTWFKPSDQGKRVELSDAVEASKDGDTSALEESIQKDVLK